VTALRRFIHQIIIIIVIIINTAPCIRTVEVMSESVVATNNSPDADATPSAHLNLTLFAVDCECC